MQRWNSIIKCMPKPTPAIHAITTQRETDRKTKGAPGVMLIPGQLKMYPAPVVTCEEEELPPPLPRTWTILSIILTSRQ